MSTTLYDRRCVLVVGRVPGSDLTEKTSEALRIEGLRVQFKIEKTDKPEPNKAEIVVYNLKASSRSDLEADRGVRVILSAGYKDSTEQLFSGDSRFVNNKREGVDWITKIEAHDSGRAFKFARVSESFSAGATAKDLVKKLVGALVKDPGNALKKAEELTRTFANGHTLSGSAAQELTELLEPEGYTWSMQDGRMEILKEGETTDDEVLKVSPDTGLIGSPEMGAPEKKKGPAHLKCKLLLRSVKPGQRFQLESAGRNGVYRARVVRMTGDTHGGDWYTEVEATPVS